MTTNSKPRCPRCGEHQILESLSVPDKWPRELSYICPNGHRNVVVELKDPKLMPRVPPTNLNVPIKYIYRSDARQEQEIELYCAAGAVRRKIGQSNPKAHNYLNQLEKYINGAILQYHRILEDHSLSIKAFWEVPHSADPPRTMQEKSIPINLTLFLDIHFWLICLDKIDKLYPKVLWHVMFIGKGEKDTSQRREKKKWVQRKFKQALLQMKSARNFHEHIEKKIQEDEFGEFRHEYHGDSHTFICGKKKYQVSISVKPIIEAYEALIKMLRSLPDLD